MLTGPPVARAPLREVWELLRVAEVGEEPNALDKSIAVK
jgi:hypothetical protein